MFWDRKKNRLSVTTYPGLLSWVSVYVFCPCIILNRLCPCYVQNTINSVVTLFKVCHFGNQCDVNSRIKVYLEAIVLFNPGNFLCCSVSHLASWIPIKYPEIPYQDFKLKLENMSMFAFFLRGFRFFLSQSCLGYTKK